MCSGASASQPDEASGDSGDSSGGAAWVLVLRKWSALRTASEFRCLYATQGSNLELAH